MAKVKRQKVFPFLDKALGIRRSNATKKDRIESAKEFSVWSAIAMVFGVFAGILIPGMMHDAALEDKIAIEKENDAVVVINEENASFNDLLYEIADPASHNASAENTAFAAAYQVAVLGRLNRQAFIQDNGGDASLQQSHAEIFALPPVFDGEFSYGYFSAPTKQELLAMQSVYQSKLDVESHIVAELPVQEVPNASDLRYFLIGLSIFIGAGLLPYAYLLLVLLADLIWNNAIASMREGNTSRKLTKREEALLTKPFPTTQDKLELAQLILARHERDCDLSNEAMNELRKDITSFEELAAEEAAQSEQRELQTIKDLLDDTRRDKALREAAMEVVESLEV